MDKIKRVWNVMCTPTAFFLGGIYMWMGEIGLGCLFIMFATNEVIKTDQYEFRNRYNRIDIPTHMRNIQR